MLRKAFVHNTHVSVCGGDEVTVSVCRMRTSGSKVIQQQVSLKNSAYCDGGCRYTKSRRWILGRDRRGRRRQ